jgi:hypothetical protein
MIEFFSEWREADRSACAAERVLSAAYMRYFNGIGDEPLQEQVDAARRKRSLADELFRVAMRAAREAGHRAQA